MDDTHTADAQAPDATLDPVGDGLNGCAPGLRSLVLDYWATCERTSRRASCPVCGRAGLEVRTLSDRGRVWGYVLHCGYPQVIWS